MSEPTAAPQGKPGRPPRKPRVTISKLERWRTAKGLTTKDVAKAINCSHDVISRAEAGIPIRRKYVERLVELSMCMLQPTDFAPPKKRKPNGKTRESKRKSAQRNKRAKR